MSKERGRSLPRESGGVGPATLRPVSVVNPNERLLVEPRASLEPKSFLLRAWWDYCRSAFSPCNMEKVNTLLSVTPFLSLLSSASPPMWKA